MGGFKFESPQSLLCFNMKFFNINLNFSLASIRKSDIEQKSKEKLLLEKWICRAEFSAN